VTLGAQQDVFRKKLVSTAHWRKLAEHAGPASQQDDLVTTAAGGEEAEIWLAAMRELLAMLDRSELIRWRETFADSSFVTVRKGVPI